MDTERRLKHLTFKCDLDINIKILLMISLHRLSGQNIGASFSENPLKNLVINGADTKILKTDRQADGRRQHFAIVD